jgi:hypothetical protein
MNPGALGVATSWGEAPPGARIAVLEVNGAEHETPVEDGHYLFAAWEVPADRNIVLKLIQFLPSGTKS